MLTAIRNKLRAWLGVPDPVAPPEAPNDDARKGLNIDPRLLAQLPGLDARQLAAFQGMPVVRREVTAPKLYPGVVPSTHRAYDGMPAFLAIDSEQFAPSWEWMRSVNCGLGFPGYSYLAELTQRSEYRAPAETIASEMTREWIIVKTAGKAGGEDDSTGDLAASGEHDDKGVANNRKPPAEDLALKDRADNPHDEDTQDETDEPTDGGAEDKIEDIVNALDEFSVRDLFKWSAEYDAFFGRAQLYIDIDYGNEVKNEEARQLPLVIDPKTIPKGSLKGFRPIEAMWTTPYYFNATDPTKPDFYVPKAWYVLGKMTHASRLLTFISREVPDMLKPAYNFGGMSLSQLMEPYVFQWLRTRNSVSDLIRNFSIIALKTNMAQVLQGEVGAGAGLIDRAKLFTQNRDNQGLMLLDKDAEELQDIAVPLSGLDALQAQAQEHMAAPSHIPLVKLLGVTPTGLNASSEGEIKVFYDFIRAQQQAVVAKHLKTMLDVVQLHLFGEIDDAISFEFLPLTSPSVKELSEIRKGDADSGRAYIEAGVISPDEERERLMADPNSGYNNLTGPAPEPPATELVNPDGTPYDPNAEPGGGGFPGAQPDTADDAEPTRVVVPQRDRPAETDEDDELEVLNGAQVSSLQGLVEAVANGAIPLETARATIAAAFPQLDEKQIAAILSPLKSFKPAAATPATE